MTLLNKRESAIRRIDMPSGLRAAALVIVLMSTLELVGQNVSADPYQDLASLTVTRARAILTSHAERGTDSSQAECLAAAIDRLGEHYKEAQDISLLIFYLGFARPMKPLNPDLPNMHPHSPGYAYPAIEALAQHGEAAREPLLSYIGKETDSLKRHNATSAFLGIKLEGAIDQLEQRRLAATPDVAARFEDAITFAKTTWRCERNPGKCE